MMQFDRLILSGFKSFVDKTELEITTGLTGIVGPNGCGKSNLVEALRWAMGENSAKRMRGGEMDDVIFNGTATRPSRNFAEVTIKLGNSGKTAPEPYTAFDEIEVSRRIEREEGSLYRINGKIARARDVQMLFADTMAGAHSPALVSQGKLTAIISAKPLDRRMILEESAGISGLYARRHEAELRLQAAENNLVRLQDITGNLETQLTALKRQARQAEKYRALSEDIRELEIGIAALEWMALLRQQQTGQHDATQIESVVAEALLTVTQLTKTLDTQSTDLPKLRTKATEAAARHQAVAIEIHQIETEEQNVARQIAETEEQLKQIDTDVTHDTHLVEDGKNLTATLEAEERQIIAEQEIQEGRLPMLEATRDSLTARLDDEDSALQQTLSRLIEIQTRRGTIDKQIDAETTKLQATAARLQETAQRLRALEIERDRDSTTAENDRTLATLEMKLADLQAKTDPQHDETAAAERALTNARQIVQTTQDAFTKAKVEKTTLETFLASDLSSTAKPVLDDIRAETGFEQALAQALGETLFGSTEDQANVIWRSMPLNSRFMASLPLDIEPISTKVQAPEELSYALSYIGYVPDRETGEMAATYLKPGQSIVSLDGYLWRWDGVFAKPSAKDRQAQILEQKNRLATLQTDLPNLEEAAADAQRALDAATQRYETARATQKATDDALRETQTHLNTARATQQKQMQDRQALAADLARMSETLRLLDQDMTEREATRTSLQTERAAIEGADTAALEQDVAAMREKVAETQMALRDASLAVDRYLQEDGRRKARLHGIADQRIALNNRSVRAAEHLEQLYARKAQMTGKLDELQQKPHYLKAARENLMERVNVLQAEKVATEDALQAVENDVNTTTRALKESELTLSTAKETRAATMARLQAMTERMDSLQGEITAQFGQTPQTLMEAVEISLSTPETDLPNLDDSKARKEKLIRDRENIGPVNLRADVEAQEIDGQLSKILSERDDLTAAIAELRAGIEKINTEARERLVAAFDTINNHFKALFTRLFGGGQAYLQMIESPDPLGAGLEIFAQPPGKALQSISLLSGGEQSLTAAALIFAMFLTNPAPICVLDEIDAPLDDANVDRICDLLRHISEQSGTRFLIVTHHRLTMARMDRLYGVTMAEKGVSQLVSVDLDRQMDLLEAA